MGTKTKVGIGVGVVVLIVAALLTTNTGIFKGAMMGGGTFSGAKWQCHDGTSTTRQGMPCKNSSAWSTEAKLACANKCSPGTGKCGLNSFYVGAKCAQPIEAGTLNVNLSPVTPASVNVIPGTARANVAIFDLNAANEDITIKDLYVNLEGTLDKVLITNVRLFNLATNAALGVSAAANDNGVFVFTDDFVVQRNSKLSVYLLADVSVAAPNGATFFASLRNAAAVNAMGNSSNVAIVARGNFPINGNVMTVVAGGGALTGAQEGSPDSSIGVAGSSGVVMSRYKFSAVNEAFTITKLDVVGTTSARTAFVDHSGFRSFTGGNNVSRVGVTYPKRDGTTETIYAAMAGGKAQFSNLNFYVPKDGNATVTVLADLNSIDLGATSGVAVRLGLNENVGASNSFEARGEASAEIKDSNSVNALAGSANVNPVVIRKTMPTVAKDATASTKLNRCCNNLC